MSRCIINQPTNMKNSENKNIYGCVLPVVTMTLDDAFGNDCVLGFRHCG